MQKFTAVYMRVSTTTQSTRSQQPDLERWVQAHCEGVDVRWFRDKFCGATMQRPGWDKVQAAIERGQCDRVVVWGLDRLGRSAAGLTALFEDLRKRGVALLSLKEGLDLSTPSGRLIANVLASVAQFDREWRTERVVAGQAAAKAAGKRWGGWPKGKRRKVSDKQAQLIVQMKADGEPVAGIARCFKVSRRTVYGVCEAAAAKEATHA